MGIKTVAHVPTFFRLALIYTFTLNFLLVLCVDRKVTTLHPTWFKSHSHSQLLSFLLLLPLPSYRWFLCPLAMAIPAHTQQFRHHREYIFSHLFIFKFVTDIPSDVNDPHYVPPYDELQISKDEFKKVQGGLSSSSINTEELIKHGTELLQEHK